MGGATVAELVGTGGAVSQFDQVPDPLARERHAAQGEEHAGRFGARGGAFARRADAGEVGTALDEVDFHGLKGSAAQGDDAFLVALAADLYSAGIENQVTG